MKTSEFLRLVVRTRQPGWMCIASYDVRNGTWRQYWYGWPDDFDAIITLIEGLKDEGLSVYYSCHLFKDRKATKALAIETGTVFCDLDKADIPHLLLPPSVLTKSSDESHQGYWFVNEWLDIEAFEELSQRVTYGIIDSDPTHGSWSIGHMMRMPNTLNYKYDPPQRARVVSSSKTVYDVSDYKVFPPLSETRTTRIVPTEEWMSLALKVPTPYGNHIDFWDSVKDKLEKDVEHNFYREQPDRSGALWRLMTACFRATLSLEQTFLIAWHSKNNKFKELRYGADEALAKDVIRAYNEVVRGPSGIRGRINETRTKTNTSPSAKKQIISDLCLNQMLHYGTFVHCRSGAMYYITNREGKPIPITRYSTQMNVLLDQMFSLNATEPEQQYVTQRLMDYTGGLPPRGEQAALSYFLKDSNTLLIHTGYKDIIRITPDRIDVVNNGYKDVVFMWQGSEAISVNLDEQCDNRWHTELFSGALNNLSQDSVTQPQAMAILRSWMVFLLMRNAYVSRPLLGVFGPQGSGKSTLFKGLYALIYGPHKGVNAVGTSNDFDYAMANDPLLVLDNVDTWEKWLPDRLARAAGTSEIVKRKLYTDLDVVVLQSQAMLGINCMNPQFGREDVMDRMLMFNLDRISDEQRYDETEMTQHILDRRTQIWTDLARDVQKVLAEPIPDRDDIPPFRVADFARAGLRTARALDYEQDFRDALQSIVDSQKGFVLTEDQILVDILMEYTKGKRFDNTKWQSSARLWSMFDTIARTKNVDLVKKYGNSVRLGRKLLTLQDALRQRFIVESKAMTGEKTRVWRFMRRKRDGTTTEQGDTGEHGGTDIPTGDTDV